MSSTAFSFPVGFSWLSPAYRPSEEEIKTYAAIIAAKEGASAADVEDFRSQAELQLWVWRSETQQRPRRRRTSRIGALRLFPG